MKWGIVIHSLFTSAPQIFSLYEITDFPVFLTFLLSTMTLYNCAWLNWNSLPRGAVDASSLKLSRQGLIKALANLICACPCSLEGTWTRWSLGVRPTPRIQWFDDSKQKNWSSVVLLLIFPLLNPLVTTDFLVCGIRNDCFQTTALQFEVTFLSFESDR